MMSRFPRTWLSLPIALLLSLLLAGQTLAATWSPPITLALQASEWDWPQLIGLVAQGRAKAIVAYYYTEAEDYFLTRTTDGGATWKPPVLVPHRVGAIAGNGPFVDMVWVQRQRVRYARSVDGGASFESSIALSPRVGWTKLSVARGPGGLVVVAWLTSSDGDSKLNVRSSSDGGATFDYSSRFSSTGDSPALAIGDGVMYVAYTYPYNVLRVRRSTDAGRTWSRARRLADNVDLMDGTLSITAAAGEAYIAYEASYWNLGYVGTHDKGARWSDPTDLLPSSWSGTYPYVGFRNGILRAAFTRCQNSGDVCAGNERVFYRQSSDGINWTAPERVSPKSLSSAYAAGVGFARKVLVLYQGVGGRPDYPYDLYIRRGAQ